MQNLWIKIHDKSALTLLHMYSDWVIKTRGLTKGGGEVDLPRGQALVVN